jgi:hypothetical protein
MRKDLLTAQNEMAQEKTIQQPSPASPPPEEG